MYMLSCIENYMAENKISTLLSDVSIEGDIVEKDKIVIDAKISGDIKAEEIDTFSNSGPSNTIFFFESYFRLCRIDFSALAINPFLFLKQINRYA